MVCAAAAAFAAATVVYQQRKGSSGKWGMAEDIVKRFGEECGTPIEKLKKVAEAMVFEMNKGLASEGGSKLKMLISFVDNLPSGFFSLLPKIFNISIKHFLCFCLCFCFWMFVQFCNQVIWLKKLLLRMTCSGELELEFWLEQFFVRIYLPPIEL